MQYMQSLFQFVQKRLFLLIGGSVFFGLLNLKLTGGYEFTPLICVFAALTMIYPSLVPLDFDQLKEIGKYKKIIAISIFVNFVIIPLFAIVIGRLFFADQPVLQIGLFLLAILPGGGMVTTWANKSKAHLPLTIGIVFSNLLVAVVLVPFYLSYAMRHVVVIQAQNDLMCPVSTVTHGALNCLISDSSQIGVLNIALPIAFIVVLPLLLAYVTQVYLKKRYQQSIVNEIGQRFGVVSNIGMIFVLFIFMGVKENSLVFSRPDLIFRAIFPIAILYGINMLVSLFLNRRYHSAEGRALVWGTYLRYVTLALGLAISLIYQNSQYSSIVLVMIIALFIQIPSSFWLLKRLTKTKS